VCHLVHYTTSLLLDIEDYQLNLILAIGINAPTHVAVISTYYNPSVVP